MFWDPIWPQTYMGKCEESISRLTGEEVPVAVGFILALLTVGHGRHLLGRGAAHLLLLSCSPPHSWALQAHLGAGAETPQIADRSLDRCFISGKKKKKNHFKERVRMCSLKILKPNGHTSLRRRSKLVSIFFFFCTGRNPLNSSLGITNFS